MKGKLTKENNKWYIIESERISLSHTTLIPLHPEDIKKYNEYLFNGGEVEFEIYQQYPASENSDVSKRIIKHSLSDNNPKIVAKITKTGAFDKEGNAITRGYESDIVYSTNKRNYTALDIETLEIITEAFRLLQNKSTESWGNIVKEYITWYRNNKKEGKESYEFDAYLMEYYLAPIKK